MAHNNVFAVARGASRSSRPTSNVFARIRQTQQRRFASSTPSSGGGGAGADAQEKAKQALAGAQRGLERAAEAAKKIGGNLGERVGSLLGSYREPLTYNFAVAREVLKQVYVAERLAPPTSFSTVSSAYQTLWSRASNPTYWREILKNGEWQRVGVYAVEAYGIFKIGEILGRRHVVGYKLD